MPEKREVTRIEIIEAQSRKLARLHRWLLLIQRAPEGTTTKEIQTMVRKAVLGEEPPLSW